MRFSPQPVGSRREFFRAAGRYSLLAVLTVATALAGRRSKLAGQRCINRGICAGCGAFAGCGLPPALSAKAFLAGGGST